MQHKNKLYTLQEAFDEISRIRIEMGASEIHSKIKQEAYAKGYWDACQDIKAKMLKEIGLLVAINTNN